LNHREILMIRHRNRLVNVIDKMDGRGHELHTL
jgi:hypothetical protein